MSFYTDVIQKDPRYNSPHVNDVVCDMNLLEPGFRAAVVQMMNMAKADGHDLRVAETYRSQARQHYLYTKGFTQVSHVGVHGYGLAADLQLLVNGKYDPNGSHYIFMHVYSTRCKVISGQGWGTAKAPHSFTDWDHIQRIPVFRQDAVFSGAWYPPEDYDPWKDMAQHNVAGIG